MQKAQQFKQLSRCVSDRMLRHASTTPAPAYTLDPFFNDRQEPRTVSLKLQKLFAQDKLDEAILSVQSLKYRDYQGNVVLWNLLMREALQKSRFSLAYSLWHDVRLLFLVSSSLSQRFALR